MPAPAEPQSRFVQAGELRLHYLDFGGDRPPLLFSHATGFHAWLWLPYARRFVDRFRVLALDHRGHGESDKPATGYRWERFGEDLARFLDALDLRDVRVVGHSKGATAIAAAVAFGCRRLVRAALVEPVLAPIPELTEPLWDNPFTVRARRRRTIWPNRDAMLASLLPKPPFVAWEHEFVKLYVEHGVADRADGQVELLCPAEVEAQVYANMPLTDGFKLLESLDVPTLLLRGTESPGFGERQAADALGRLAAGTLVTVPGAGHFLPMERSAAVLKALDVFLG